MWSPNERATGIKNVSINEHYFQGHFPARPVMPGVLIIEAMAQTAAVLVVHTLGPGIGRQARLFHERRQCPLPPPGGARRPHSHVHVTKQRNRGNVWKFEGRAEGRRPADGRSGVRRDDPGPIRPAPGCRRFTPRPSSRRAPCWPMTSTIGPYCVVGEHVTLGAGVRLRAHVVIDGRTHDRRGHANLPVRLDRASSRRTSNTRASRRRW